MKNTKNFLIIIIIFCVFFATSMMFFRYHSQKEKGGDNNNSPQGELLRSHDEDLFPQTLSLAEPVFQDRVCNIVDYGAVGGGKIMNTHAFAAAIADCAKLGGGEVLVPSGVWLTGAIALESNIQLHLDKGAKILFSGNIDEYLPLVRSRFEGVEYYNYSSPLSARNAKNVAITGEGTIDGQAEKSWWTSIDEPIVTTSMSELYRMGQDGVPLENRIFGKDKGLRPAFVEFFECNTVLIDGVTFVNGPMWTIHPLYSDTVSIRNITIRTRDGRNTDGIVVDSSRNVSIEDSHFSTGDDAIAIKSGRDNDGMRVGRPSENILIKNCTVEEAHAALALGSEVSGGVRDIFVDTIHVKDADFGIRMKSSLGRGASVQAIRIRNITIDNARIAAIELDQMTGENVSVGTALTDFGDIHIENIACGWTRKPILINGSPEKPPHDISLTHLSISASGTAFMENVRNVRIENLTLNSSRKGKESGIEIADSEQVVIRQTNLPKEKIICRSGCMY
ncbi:MAG: glycoside hydrolase family 28 protein [Candidatus Moraniibacteriota bacterium]|nr:MAG: glycoside hydrolase family 28 protein [Candidatus Moranbacteria bacterium]